VIVSDDMRGILQSLGSHGIFWLIRGGNAMYKVEVLERKRLEKGLSYTEIAEKLGIHKVTVSRTLKGMTMKPRTVKLLADYLSVEMEGIVQ
jgi:cyanate lyase